MKLQISTKKPLVKIAKEITCVGVCVFVTLTFHVPCLIPILGSPFPCFFPPLLSCLVTPQVFFTFTNSQTLFELTTHTCAHAYTLAPSLKQDSHETSSQLKPKFTTRALDLVSMQIFQMVQDFAYHTPMAISYNPTTIVPNLIISPHMSRSNDLHPTKSPLEYLAPCTTPRHEAPCLM